MELMAPSFLSSVSTAGQQQYKAEIAENWCCILTWSHVFQWPQNDSHLIYCTVYTFIFHTNKTYLKDLQQSIVFLKKCRIVLTRDHALIALRMLSFTGQSQESSYERKWAFWARQMEAQLGQDRCNGFGYYLVLFLRNCYHQIIWRSCGNSCWRQGWDESLDVIGFDGIWRLV